MAQYYQIQNLDDLKQIYADVQVVHVASDDVGVSNPNRAQQIVLDETQQILLQNDGPQQVVYQTQGTPTQYQPPQAGTHYTILGEDMNQPQAQQQPVVQQQTQQPQHQQQVLMHQQQQHQVMDHQQQHQLQAAYQLPQEPQQPQQQHMQPQEHQIQQQQQHVQAQAQPIYYATDQIGHQQQQQQQQKKVYIQQQPLQQQQYQPHPQHQQLLHQPPPPPPPPQQQPQQQQQHLLQSPHHQQQQVQVQHQASPSHQQQPQQTPQQQQPQIIYRMQPQPTQQLIVQQPSGQHVLIQQQPQQQQQELIMRQSMPQQRIIYNNRLIYSAPQQQSPQQQQQTLMAQSPQPHQQQQHIQLQTNAMHNQTHLVQQSRVVSQHQQQQQPTSPPNQQMQQNVVFQQIVQQSNQMPKTIMQQQQQNSPQHQQHLQLQHQQQQQQQQQQAQIVGQPTNPNGTTIVRGISARGSKLGRGAMSATMIARMPAIPGGATRTDVRPGGAGQILRTPRPRCSTTAGTTSRGRGRGSRGAAAAAAAAAAAGRGAGLLGTNPQLGTLQQGKVVTQSLPTPGGIRQVYRAQINDASGGVQQQQQQQVHLVHAQPRMPGGVARFRLPSVGVQQQQQQQQAAQQNTQQPTTSTSTSTSGGNYELDLEDSIQAVFVKKDAQNNKVPSAPNQNTTNTPAANSSSPQMGGTTLTTFYTAATTKEDDENRMIRTQNGTCMSLAEYKKRNANSGSQIMQTSAPSAGVAAGIKPLPQTAGGAKITLPATGQSLHTVPVARVAPQKHIGNKDQGGGVGVTGVVGVNNTTNTSTTTTTTQLTSGPPAGSSVYQTSHNNYEIQTQHVLQNRAGQQMAEKDRNSAKMLVILVSGEQRLITFTLPRESCTVQDLLEQVGVPFDNTTTIQCVENPGANIDFVVTVGFSVQESASELISRAEQSLQISRQQESLQQNPATVAAAVSTSSSESAPQNNTATATAAAAAVSASTSSAASIPTTENTTKEIASNAKLAAAATSSPSSSSKAEELPQRKLIQGFYAICQSCGFSGYDHAKCERCKRVFLEPPKKIPIKQATAASSLANSFTTSSSASGSSESSTSSTLTIEKKRHPETGSQRGKSSLSYNPNATSTRGRGGSQSGRGRGSRAGRRAAEIEPVILTLSSDEEDDESSNQGKSNMSASVTPANISPSLGLTTYKPFSFEPNMPEPDETEIYNDFTRGDVTDLTNCADKLSCSLSCKLIRMGTYRFEPVEQVIITSQGIRITAPLETDPSESFALNIYKHEVVKIIAHFSKNSAADSMLCLYTLRSCAQYIRNSLKMPEIGAPLDGVTYFSASGPYQIRKIILQFSEISERARSVIRSIWDFLDEISDSDAQDLLQRASASDLKLANNKNSETALSTTTQIQPNEIRQLLIYPPGKGGISINTEDYMCLATDQYLNDIIIDFYLKWVHDNIIPETQKERTHIFSTFFYKRLTTLTRHAHQDKDIKQTAAQKRHARVQNWTKNVNIFEKDFIVIPINEQSHWFLAIICFPRLKGPVTFDTNVPVELQPIKKTKGKKVSLQIGNTTITPLSKRDSANVLSEICGVGDDDSERDEAEGDESDLASEDSDFDSSSTNTVNNSQPVAPLVPGTAITSTHQPIKQPLILIFDSLAGASRSRVVATLRDYLTCEYKIKMPDAPLHSFNKDNMPGHCVKVPQQNNFTDCGLYLLQYVEHFFKDPIRDYRVPIKQLAQWFDTLTVTRKREDISFLLQKLMNERNGPNNKVILPEIPFPTLNGQLVEPDGYNIEFEEEDMEDDEEEENTTGDMEELSTDDTSKSKTPIKMAITTGVASTTATTAAALVPTQGRKIVVKRRMQISGNNETNSPQGNSTTTTICTTPPSTSHPRTSMAKIRKVEP